MTRATRLDGTRRFGGFLTLDGPLLCFEPRTELRVRIRIAEITTVTRSEEWEDEFTLETANDGAFTFLVGSRDEWLRYLMAHIADLAHASEPRVPSARQAIG
jgi:hypothetical protein